MDFEKRLKTLNEINVHCHTHILLIVDEYGKIRFIYCPFKVAKIKNGTDDSKPVEMTVESVKTNRELLLIYQINGELYPYYEFKLV